MADRSKGLNRALWVASGLLAALFLFAGFGGKLLNPEEATKLFSAHFGYPGYLALFIGACETAGAIGILIPRLATPAAAGLAIIMAGAAVSHLQAGDSARDVMVPLVVLALLAFVGWTRLPDLRRRSAIGG